MTTHTDPWSHGHEGPGFLDQLPLDRPVWDRFTASDGWVIVSCADRDRAAGCPDAPLQGLRTTLRESLPGEAVVTEWSGPDGPVVLDVVGSQCWHLVPPSVLPTLAPVPVQTLRPAASHAAP